MKSPYLLPLLYTALSLSINLNQDGGTRGLRKEVVQQCNPALQQV